MEGAILLIVAIAALGAFLAGVVLLALYFRAGRASRQPQRPAVYGSLVQCARCGYMNPSESALCLNCRAPLANKPLEPVAPAQAPPPAQAPYRSPVTPYLQTYLGDQSAVPHDPRVQAPAPSPVMPQPAAPPPPPAPNRPAGMPHAWLEGLGGAMMGHRAVLQQADTLVGRSTVCDVQVYDPKVSRKHCMIRYANGAFFVQDQQSSRGTLVNGARVMAQRLNNGDRIEIGDTVMVLHIEPPGT